jgi:hypothetical protein
MRLNLQSLLPNFVIIDTAGEHDNKRARELCAGIKSGEIVLFDKGYVDFEHLRDLDERGVFWVTRAKDNLAYEVVRVSVLDIYTLGLTARKTEGRMSRGCPGSCASNIPERSIT